MTNVTLIRSRLLATNAKSLHRAALRASRRSLVRALTQAQAAALFTVFIAAFLVSALVASAQQPPLHLNPAVEKLAHGGSIRAESVLSERPLRSTVTSPHRRDFASPF